MLLAAHGTRDDAGVHTIEALVSAVAAARPALDVRHGFLDVRAPTLADVLAELGGPVVVVPMLLSTGYHVTVDIPAVVAGRPDTSVTRHLGPHRLLSLALADRLAAVDSARGPVALVATGSSLADARVELDEAAADLAQVIRRPVRGRTVGESLAGVVAVAPYVLAEGHFADEIHRAAAGRPIGAVLGAHPRVVELVLARYDAAAAR